MFCFALPLVALLLPVSNARAIQLGDRREQIVAQYGMPINGDLPSDRGIGTYRWNGWRLDVEITQGVAQRLIFTKDTAPLNEAEERQLLNDNGGVALWQTPDHVAVDTLAAKKWRRVGDGAEAFTLSNDARVMCLTTGAWAEAWTRAHASAVQRPNAFPSSIVRTKTPGDNRSPSSPTAPASPLAGLIVLAGFAGFVAFVGRAITQASKKKGHVSQPTPNPLWASSEASRHLKSACAVTSPSLPITSGRFRVSNFPKPKTLDDLSWQEFELMIGEHHRRQGYAVELCSGDGSDGGVDLWLRKDGRTVLVQCKHWKVYKVGVSPVRELFGVLAAEKADYAIFVTTGRFTPDARAFAAGKPMDLIDGGQLETMVAASKYSAEGDLLDIASWSDTFARAATITTPVCPFCRSSMVLRRGKQSGNQFWGCSTYPGCRGKRNVRPELMKV